MAIAADRLALDLSALPWHAERFGPGSRRAARNETT